MLPKPGSGPPGPPRGARGGEPPGGPRPGGPAGGPRGGEPPGPPPNEPADDCDEADSDIDELLLRDDEGDEFCIFSGAILKPHELQKLPVPSTPHWPHTCDSDGSNIGSCGGSGLG